MSDDVKRLTDADFDEATSQGVTLVDFFAPWCAPCRMLTPVLETVAGKLGDRATVAKVDVDQNPQVAGRYGVMSIPTIIVLKDGEEKQRLVGLQSEAMLIGAVLGTLESAVAQ